MRVPTLVTPRTNPAQPRQNYVQGGQFSSPDLGSSLVQLSQLIDQRQQKREAFDVSKRVIEETNALQMDYSEREKAEPLGAKGFTQRINDDYTARHQDILESYREMGYSKESLRELDTRLSALRQSFTGRALNFQYNSFKGLADKELKDLTVSLSQYATNNPAGIESALTELQVAIKNLDGLEDTDAQQLYDHYSSVILQGAGEGLALYNPQSVVDLLAPEEITTTVIDTPTGRFDVDSYMAANRSAESSGDDGATATTSSAVGRYQFLKGTWLEYYKKAYPNSGKTDQQILAERSKGDVQDKVMRVFTLENVQRLEAANIPISNASVYLAHFLGVKGAIDAYTSPAARRVTDFLPSDTINANKAVFKKGMTAGDLVIFAEKKVGGPEAQKAAQQVVTSSRVVAPASAAPPPPPVTMVIPANLPVDPYQAVQNNDGTISTVRTISIGTDVGEVLIPTVIDGKVVSDEEAIKHYDETGEHLGVFKNAEEADKYAEWLHTRHESQLAPTGNPVLDRMTGSQRLDVLQKARAELSRQGAQNRAGVDIKMNNEVTAYLETGEYAGEPTTQEELIASYGPEIGAQKWQQIQDAREIGPFVKELKMLTPQEAAARLAAMKPTDTSSPTYATELRSYQLAEQAVSENMKLREADPAAYTYRQFPNIIKMLQGAQTADQRKAAYAALEKAYKQLGTPKDQQLVMTKEMAEQQVESYRTKTVQQKIATVETWFNEMSATQISNTIDQMQKSGFSKDILLFLSLRGHPQYRTVMTNVMAGQEIIAKDSSRRPNAGNVNSVYRNAMGSALASLNPEASQVYKESATALYVQMGGDPSTQGFDQDLYERALNQVVGGVDGRDGTGIVDMSQGKVPDKTVLPPGINRNQFENWVEGLAVGDLTRLSVGKRPPVTTTGKGVPTQDIIDYGVFVMVSPGRYVIKMGNTGGRLLTSDGTPFIVNIGPETVRGRR